MEEEELEFVEELEAVLQLTPDVQLAIEQVSVPPPEGRRVAQAPPSQWGQSWSRDPGNTTSHGVLENAPGLDVPLEIAAPGPLLALPVGKP